MSGDRSNGLSRCRITCPHNRTHRCWSVGPHASCYCRECNCVFIVGGDEGPTMHMHDTEAKWDAV